jgi:polyisoprenoid-binding protein YceI/predicted MFS family arabinose efflux permease
MAITEAGRPARAERAELPRLVWVLAGGSFVNNLGGFVVPFLVVYLIHRGYSAGLAAGAVSGYAAGKMAAGPAGGLLIDRLGARATTAASMAGSAPATLALAVVRGPVPTIVTAALTGLVSQLYRPATSAMLAAVPGQQRVRAFSVYQLGVSAGAAAGPAIGGVVAEHSFLVLFSCDAATSLAWAVLAWRVPPGTLAAAAPGHPGPRALRTSVLRDRRLARLLAVTVLANLILFQAQTTLPLWVHRQGLSTGSYGLLLALNSGLVMALQLPAARLTRRWRPEPVIAATSVLVGAGFGLLALARTPALLAAAVTVWSLGELAQWPVAAAYTTALAAPGMIGRYAAARSFCYGAALLLAPITGTALYRLGPALLWGACAAAGICAAAVITRRRPCTARPGGSARRSLQRSSSAPTWNTGKEAIMTTARSATQQTRASVPAPGLYRLDPARSSVTFRTRHLFGLGKVGGTMAVTSGEITIGPTISEATVTAVVSAESFDTGSRIRDRDVRSAKFLDAGQYPHITFRAGTLTQAGGRWMLAGQLTIRQTSSPVTLAIDSVEPAGPGFRAHATTRIDRYALGVTAAKGMAASDLDIDLAVTAEPMLAPGLTTVPAAASNP